jgi:ACS family glucarate transporter-like MFS transporter
MVAANGFYSLGVMFCCAVCTDIGRNNAGTVSGAMNCFGQLGAFFLAIVFGNMVNAGASAGNPLFVIAAAQLIGFLLWFFIDPTKPLPLEEMKVDEKLAQST